MKFTVYTPALAALFGISTFLASCTQTKESAVTIQPNPRAVYVDSAVQIDRADEAKDPEYEEPRTDVILRFEHVSLAVEFGELWNDEGYFDKTHEDSIVVKFGLSGQMFGQRYALRLDSSIQKIEIFQNYETSLTVMNEGPHMDLTDWKHYVSDWEELVIADGGFQTAEYTDADFEVFLDVTTDEIVQAIKDLYPNAGDWVEIAERCQGPQGYPCGVSISRITVKLVLTYTSEITVERFIVFEVPMGC